MPVIAASLLDKSDGVKNSKLLNRRLFFAWQRQHVNQLLLGVTTRSRAKMDARHFDEEHSVRQPIPCPEGPAVRLGFGAEGVAGQGDELAERIHAGAGQQSDQGGYLVGRGGVFRQRPGGNIRRTGAVGDQPPAVGAETDVRFDLHVGAARLGERGQQVAIPSRVQIEALRRRTEKINPHNSRLRRVVAVSGPRAEGNARRLDECRPDPPPGPHVPLAGGAVANRGEHPAVSQPDLDRGHVPHDRPAGQPASNLLG